MSTQLSEDTRSRYNRVSEWDTKDVCMWINGLSESLSQHVTQFEAHSITGSDLLKLTRQQLEYLKVNQVGHQELLIEAIELLASVDNARSRQSTIALASALSKKTSQLVKALGVFERCDDKIDDSNFLSCFEFGATVLQATKFLIGWLDRFPTELIDDYKSFRSQLLDGCFDLSSAMSKNYFDFRRLSDICSLFLKLTSGLMSPEFFNKPDPLSLVTVTLLPHTEKGLGFSIQRTRRGALVISHIEENSPAQKCGKLSEGVELIQINHQNVVCWEVKNVVKSLKASGHEVNITVRVSSNKAYQDLDGQVFSDLNMIETDSSFVTNNQKKQNNMHITLEKVPSSPAIFGDEFESNVHSPTSTLVDKHFMSQKSQSVSDNINVDKETSSGDTSSQSSTNTSRPIIAYKTEIIGGVVHRVPIQAVEDPTASNYSTGKGRKTGSLKRMKRNKSRSNSLSDSVEHIHQSKGSGSTVSPSEPQATSPLIDTFAAHVTDQVAYKGSVKKTNPALFIPCFQVKDPEQEGWVNKQGGSGLTPKNWRRRWFVLKEGKVYYYKTRYDIQAQGIVDLRGYKVEEAHDIKKKHAFKVTRAHSRTYYFFTDSMDETLRWIEAMTKASEFKSYNEDLPEEESVESCDDIEDD